MIRLSGTRNTDRVTITGRNRLDLFLDLCHRGFVQANCETGTGRCCSDETDTLWISCAGTERELTNVLNRIGRSLRPGGTIIVHDNWPAHDATRSRRIRTLRRLLTEHGFIPLLQDADGGSGLLLTARKPIATTLRAAGERPSWNGMQ